MKTLIIDKLPHLFLCQGDKNLISRVSPAYQWTKIMWLWSELPGITPVIPEGVGGEDPEISNDWYVTE